MALSDENKFNRVASRHPASLRLSIDRNSSITFFPEKLGRTPVILCNLELGCYHCLTMNNVRPKSRTSTVKIENKRLP